MKKTILSVLVLSFLASCGGVSEDEMLSTDIVSNPISADNQGEEEKKLPFFEFEDDVKEFGEITQGEVVSTTFKFKNVGQADLIISSAQASCGCTVPSWPKEPIKPGGEGVIEVKFDSNGKQGLQSKTITLIANTIPNTKVIALKGEVLTPKSDK